MNTTTNNNDIDTENNLLPIGTPCEPYLDDKSIYVLANQLDDLEGLRQAQDNRIRILTTCSVDKDGEVRGFGMSMDAPTVKDLLALQEGTKQLEHENVLKLQKAMRKHPLWQWAKQQKGVGEKTLARLLGIIGDPYVNATTHTVRSVSQLWAYCGLHTLTNPDGGSNIAARRMKGVQANWNTNAKTRAYLIAEALVKAGVRKHEDGSRYPLTEYGRVYIQRREHTLVTHPEWTPGHSQNDAMRILMKAFLKDLWRAARDIHNQDISPDSLNTKDNQ